MLYDSCGVIAVHVSSFSGPDTRVPLCLTEKATDAWLCVTRTLFPILNRDLPRARI